MKRLMCAIIGGVYGIVLFVFGYMAAGAGHGVLAPLGIFSSPIALVHPLIPQRGEYQTFEVSTFLLATPLLWGLAGWFSASLPRRSAKWGLFGLLAIHYLAMFAVLHNEDFGSWEHCDRVWEYCPWVLILGFSIYFIGQAVLWVLLLIPLVRALREAV
jgi:hypothetical protein